jgi:hypothetical protein
MNLTKKYNNSVTTPQKNIAFLLQRPIRQYWSIVKIKRNTGAQNAAVFSFEMLNRAVNIGVHKPLCPKLVVLKQTVFKTNTQTHLVSHKKDPTSVISDYEYSLNACQTQYMRTLLSLPLITTKLRTSACPLSHQQLAYPYIHVTVYRNKFVFK